ncbi:endonuclease/exonuclease/phosphatase family protein [Aliikangiella coralliicola]|uniref:Endonuclease/exonuclease/phosphatase family protein n=1 Tax=Aliikangiella coralliicola TaxID=2592383 RepID=A0A545UDU8_9GAMM|nr:endonuclease/exonuclease/phosphatase family protein [Aliikangiella coralliicola]TQV87641.1 endonuclease/exonuclease/phosphatase family protein [Aliikangiella coralliicola]
MIYFSSVVSIAATPYLCTPLDLDGDLTKAKHVVRVATFNAYLNRRSEGQLITDLQSTDHPQIVAVTEIIQRVRPDILLLNEFDYDANGTAIDLLQSNYLAVGQNGQQPIEYPYVFIAESNTGIPSGFDFDNDGKTNGPGDAYGFGFFPGQYGMVVLSRYPIDRYRARTFQHFLWKDMPGALLPDDPTTDEPYDYYSQQELSQFRLSSKSHWDIPVFVNGKRLHLLAAHPTPPVFDGVEDRNGRRNHDEIRFWADYVGGYRKSYYIYDDNGRRGGLPSRSAFVILGDYNADPNDGDSTQNAISQLLTHPAIDNSLSLGSFGGMEDSAKEAQANSQHTGKSVLDTGDFNPAGPGNLRVDYVLPSKRKNDVECGGVFWPTEKDDTRYLVGDGFPVISSDHRLVWIDLKLNNSWK